MVNRKGVAATMMGALAKANVNLKAIAQARTDTCSHTRTARAAAQKPLAALHVAHRLLGFGQASRTQQAQARYAMLCSSYNLELLDKT